MIRTEALAYLNATGFDPVMLAAGRLTTDTVQGYKPAIDRSLRYLGVPPAQYATYDVPDADEPAYEALLAATTYDLVLPAYALMVDQSVDAPLTSIKASQAYKQMKDLRDMAWDACAPYGYGGTDFVFSIMVLDHLEPVSTSTEEF